MAKRDNAPKKRQTKNRLTSNQREWKHQVTNLKRRIKDLEGLGVNVTYTLPDMPKSVRKRDIEKLKAIRREQLLKGAFTVYAYGEVGEAFIPKIGERAEYRRHIKEAKELERQAELGRAEREEEERLRRQVMRDIYDEEPPSISNVQIDNLRSMIDELGDPDVISQLNSILDRAISDDGIDNVVYRIEGNFGQLKDAAQQAVKYRGQAKGAGSIAAFAQVIYNKILSFSDLVSLESASDFNDDFSLPL